MPRSQLVEEQISKLVHSNEINIKDSKSPTVQKLRNEENTVNKLRQIFEDKTSPDNKLNGNKTKKSPSPSQILRSLNCRRRSTPKTSNIQFPVKKIDRIIAELIEKEHDYIDALENGIKNYVQPILDPSECHIPVPREIRLQKFKLFGNIEDIYRLHVSTILPQITACENNAQKIAQTFINFVDNDTFYSYIDYVIIHLHAKEMVTSYLNFFQTLQHKCGDRLGVQSFILQPIQKLPRYPLLFEEMIKELSTDMQENKFVLASLCVAKKKLEKYLVRLNQALKLNDIVETHDLAIAIQYNALTNLQLEFDQDINKPNFFIVPSITCFADYRVPVNVFDLGRFLSVDSFECEEHEPYLQYPGEVFLFQKSLLYTKKCGRGDKNCLSYRDIFKFGPYTSIHLEQEQKSFTIGDIKNNKIVTFKAHSIEKAIQFYDVIKIYHDQQKQKSFDSALKDDSCSSNGSTVLNSQTDNTNKYAKNYYNNNQPVIHNDRNIRDDMTSQDNVDDGNFGWSSDDEFSSDFSGSDEYQVIKKKHLEIPTRKI